MGTPDFALCALKAIDQSAHEVVCIYSQPPRPKGRGHKVTPSPVHQYGLDHDIPVFHPLNFKDQTAIDEFCAQDVDVAIVAAYGLILPQSILNAPQYGCINIHGSLLPRWRGAAPIQRAILAGDRKTGIGIMQMEAGLDTGPVIDQQTLEITAQTTASVLHDGLAALGSKMIVQCLDRLATDGFLESTPQVSEEVTYAHMLKKEEGRIDWQQGAMMIDRQIRALNPWPGVWGELNGQRFKILSAELVPDGVKAHAGEIIDESGLIACDDGAIRALSIQPAGKKAMDFAAACRGGYLKIGDRFS